MDRGDYHDGGAGNDVGPGDNDDDTHDNGNADGYDDDDDAGYDDAEPYYCHHDGDDDDDADDGFGSGSGFGFWLLCASASGMGATLAVGRALLLLRAPVLPVVMFPDFGTDPSLQPLALLLSCSARGIGPGAGSRLGCGIGSAS
eukprot:4340725-Pyramimonas_sp.AAC.1